MENRPPLKLTPFDRMVTTELLQTMKLLLPFLPPSGQRMLGIYIKYTELANTVRLFDEGRFPESGGSRQRNLDPETLAEELAPYLPPDAAQAVESMREMMDMAELMKAMGEAGGAADLFTAEGRRNHERMDEQPGTEESRSGEAGADPDGGRADEGKKREEPGSGHADPDQ